MKILLHVTTASIAGLLAIASAAPGQAQGSSGGTSGPAAGGNVKPSTTQDFSGVPGPAGSKNGPSSKTSPATRQPLGDVASPTGGVTGSAAGVAGPAGSKNGPAQRSGSPSPK
jgi:hypothetical protein